MILINKILLRNNVFTHVFDSLLMILVVPFNVEDVFEVLILIRRLLEGANMEATYFLVEMCCTVCNECMLQDIELVMCRLSNIFVSLVKYMCVTCGQIKDLKIEERVAISVC